MMVNFVDDMFLWMICLSISVCTYRSHVSLAMGEHAPITKENSVTSLVRKESEGELSTAIMFIDTLQL